MDRPLTYPGAIPAETDVMTAAKNALVGLGFLYQDLIGSATLAAALPCTPGSGLNVSLGAGRIYSLQEIDATAYSSVGIDTHTVVKQGILHDAVLLAVAAPATAGQSINYLIEASYADVDTNLVTLPYYNATNPLLAYSGPENNGAAQATTRSGEILLQVKAGAAAATGSQVTPAADSGYIGLYVVTVAQGAASIVSGNIVQLTANFVPQGPFMSASAGPYATEVELAAAVSPLATSAATAAALVAALGTLIGSAALGSFKIGPWIFNFGTAVLSSDPITINFETPYVNACYVTIPVAITTSGGDISFMGTSAPSASKNGFTAYSSVTSGISFCWFSIGQ